MPKSMVNEYFSKSSTHHTKEHLDEVFDEITLTFVKGNGCEYRHSDIAQVNPRDCWYWLNENCLNPKCAFRYPVTEVFYFRGTSCASGSSKARRCLHFLSERYTSFKKNL